MGYNPNDLRELEIRLNYSFKSRPLLEQALTHSSFAHEAGTGSKEGSGDYEALEFLGDAILGFLISEYLFRTHLSLKEGELSKIRSYLVSSKHLTTLSRRLNLGAFLRLGHGEEKTGGRRKEAILADLFESIVAAIYLDGGWEPTRHFVFSQFAPALEKISQDKLNFRDTKSLLQEKLHDLGLPEPTYQVVDELGPDHEKQFVVEVYVQDKFLAKATGKSKKEAQQQAAGLALKAVESGLGLQEIPECD